MLCRSQRPTTRCSTQRYSLPRGSKSLFGAGEVSSNDQNKKLFSLCRVQIKMWAVVRIQRCFKRFLKRKAQQKESKKKVLMIKALVSTIFNKHCDHIEFVLSARTRRSVGRSTSRETIMFLLRPQLLRSIDLVVNMHFLVHAEVFQMIVLNILFLILEYSHKSIFQFVHEDKM